MFQRDKLMWVILLGKKKSCYCLWISLDIHEQISYKLCVALVITEVSSLVRVDHAFFKGVVQESRHFCTHFPTFLIDLEEMYVGVTCLLDQSYQTFFCVVWLIFKGDNISSVIL